MSADPLHSTRRFSNRVEDYVRYRPGYPQAVIETLQREAGLKPGSVVADVGSGTGISAKPLLEHGCEVFAIEPNADMRRAAEGQLGGNPRFHSVSGAAEKTTLAAKSVDFVVAAQAFHWFDRDAARREFARILRPGGKVVVMWNTRLTEATAFLRDYEALLQRFSTDYGQVVHTNIGAAELEAFFAAGRYTERRFPNQQALDFDGTKGRLLSSSYVPAAGQPNHDPMLAELRRIFDAHAESGRVMFLYETEVYWGEV